MIERSILIATLALFAVFWVHPCTASEQERTRTTFASQELDNYAKRMGLDTVSLSVEIGATPGNTHFLAEHVQSEAEEAFLIGIDGDMLRLVGNSERGTLYAVYAFLELQGCRFFGPGPLGEVVPSRTTWLLPDDVWVRTPAIGTREIGGGPPPGITFEQAIDWRAKNRLNRAFALRPTRVPETERRRQLAKAWTDRGGMRRWQWIAHNFGFMFPPEQGWFDKHPEYFAWYEGRRRRPGSEGRPYYGGGNLALTNPDVVDHVASFAIDWFDRHPDGEVVPVWPNDGAIYWDESPEALALGGRNFTPGPEGSMTRRLTLFANAVARRVAEHHPPDKLILLPAYANYIEPIDDVPLEPNVFVQYCYHGDYAHAPTAEINAKSAEQMRRWASQTDHFGVWEYFLIGDIHETKTTPVLLPLVYRVRDTMRFFDELGLTHYFTQANPIYQPHNTLLFYATARYAWDPWLDANKLIDDYCHHAFGPDAGEPMAGFYRVMEASCLASDWQPMTYADVATPSPRVFTPEVVQRMAALLEQAKTSPMTEEQAARLAMIDEAFHATRNAIRVAEVVDLSGGKPWRLARLRSAYIVNPDGPEVDTDRFRSLVQHAVDTGGGGPALQRTAFRTPRRVEPMQRITSDHLALDILPGLGGRAIRLTDRRTGWNYFAEGSGDDTLPSIGAGYFNYGGYETYTGRGFAQPGWEQAFEVVSQNTASIVLETQGDGWRLKRTYDLAAKPGTLRIVDELTAKEAAQLALRTHPQLTLGGSAGRAELYRRSDRQAWTRIDRLRGLHDQIRRYEPNTTIEEAVWSPDLRRGLAWTTTVDHAEHTPESYVFVGDNDAYFQLERFGPSLRLEPGDTYRIVQDIRPIFHAPDAPAETSTTQGNTQIVTGQPAQWIDDVSPGHASGRAARFGGQHKLRLHANGLGRDRGTIAAWFRLPKTEANTPGWLLSVGDNRDAWLLTTVDATGLTWIAKLGEAPYTRTGEAYVSVKAAWPEGSLDGWHHLVITWDANGGDAADVVVYLDGQAVERRQGVGWPASFPAGPVVIGGNSASAAPAGFLDVKDLALLPRALTSDEVEGLMEGLAPPAEAAWRLPLDGDTRVLHGLQRD
ncbi:MAG: DUF4838 domain-containing protein [Planctomycetota bacterium]